MEGDGTRKKGWSQEGGMTRKWAGLERRWSKQERRSGQKGWGVATRDRSKQGRDQMVGAALTCKAASPDRGGWASGVEGWGHGCGKGQS